MTADEFNLRYKDYLKEEHYGLDINIPEVVYYLDNVFQTLKTVEGFKYSQIKLKFGMARFYCEPKSINTSKIEQEIEQIIKELK